MKSFIDKFERSRLLTILMALALALGTTTLVTGCDNQGPAEEAGESIDEAMEDAGDSIEDAADDVEDEFEDN